MAEVAAPTHDLLSTRAATFSGVLGSLGLVAVIGAAEAIRTGAGVEVAAITLATCYATYAGIALTRGSMREIQIENAFLLIGLTLVGLGLWHRPQWLALGWALHGGWDLLHRHDHHVIGTEGVPPWYAITCMVWDPIVAVGILLLL